MDGRSGSPGQGRRARRAPRPLLEARAIALAELDRVVAAGVRFGPVLADAGYGISAAFRQALPARGLTWAVGIPRIQKVFPAEVEVAPPPPARRPSHQQPLVPAAEAIGAEAGLQGQHWRAVTWRHGAKGAPKAAFAARRVRVADGPAVRLHGRNNQHMPGEARQRRCRGLVGEGRASGERKCYLPNLPGDAPLKRLAAAIKGRWACERAHQQLKEELGLDHFEGRSWTGLHRHALMAPIAFASLQHRRLAAGWGKKERTATAAEPAGGAAGHRRPAPAHPPAPSALPALPGTAHAAPPRASTAKVGLVG